jgi:hypothetical protein
MAVEARFVCAHQKVVDQTSSQVLLLASTSGRDNTEWAPNTPSGQIHLDLNGPAGRYFTTGKRYRVLIEEVGSDE